MLAKIATAIVLAGLAVFALVFYLDSHPAPAPVSNYRMTQVTLSTDSTGSTSLTTSSSPQATVEVEIADTDALRTLGLSYRPSLAEGAGMLFIFQQPVEDGFWMKDMQFPLDMLWADASGTIVTITRDALPSSYNSQDPQASRVFYPAKPIMYVLEVNAGFAAAHNVQVGEKMQIAQ